MAGHVEGNVLAEAGSLCPSLQQLRGIGGIGQVLRYIAPSLRLIEVMVKSIQKGLCNAGERDNRAFIKDKVPLQTHRETAIGCTMVLTESIDIIEEIETLAVQGMAVGIKGFLQLGQAAVADAMGYFQGVAVAVTVLAIVFGDEVETKELVAAPAFVIDVQIKREVSVLDGLGA